MKDAIKARAARLLEEKAVDGFLALKEQDGKVAPCVFTGADELDALSLGDHQDYGDARYPLIKILTRLFRAKAGQKLAVLVRGCDERALMRRINDDRVAPLDASKIVPLGFSCPPELAERCQCAKPWPDVLTAGEKTPGVEPLAPGGSAPDIMQRLEEWFAESDRCLKCFGCRNVCPVCACLECTMEEENFIPQGKLPASRNFLMTRAMHMVDRCVYCGLCEQACPADIPLKSLYRMVAGLTAGPASFKGASDSSQAQAEVR